MLDKFTNEASSAILGRFKNPFIGSFAISWFIFNWSAIFYLIFSKSSTEHKISFVTNYTNDNHLLLYPLGGAAFYLLIVPLINTFCTLINQLFANKWDELLRLKARIKRKKDDITLEKEAKEFRAERMLDLNVEILNERNIELEKKILNFQENISDTTKRHIQEIENLKKANEFESNNQTVKIADLQLELEKIRDQYTKLQTDHTEELNNIHSNNGHVFRLWQVEKQQLLDNIETITRERDDFHEAENKAFGELAELRDKYDELKIKYGEN